MDKLKEINEKYRKDGAEALSPREMLIMLLSCCPPQEYDTAADKLLRDFNSIYSVFERDPSVLMRSAGISESAAILLNMQSALARRCAIERIYTENSELTHKALCELVKALFLGCSTEHFYAIALTRRGRLITTSLLSKGTIGRSNIYTRKVMELALSRHRVAGSSSGMQEYPFRVAFAHNHPNGNPVPSVEDIKLTYSLIDALSAVNVEFEDHFIYTSKYIVSMKNDIHILSDKVRRAVLKKDITM